MAEYDLTQMANNRLAIISAIVKNPKEFGALLYKTISKGLFSRKLETFSPYFTTNEVSLCCIIDKTATPEEQQQWPLVCNRRENVETISTGKSGEILKVPNGMIFALKVVEISNLGIDYRTQPPTSLKNVKAKLDILANCRYTDVTRLVYLASDEFTNELLISYWLDYYYNSPESFVLQGYLKYYAATICDSSNRRHGTFLTEYAEYKSIKEWSKNTAASAFALESSPRSFTIKGQPVTSIIFSREGILDIVKQVIANLLFLQEYFQFNHGDLRVENILVANIPTRFSYNGLIQNSNVTYKISDYSKAAMTVYLKDNFDQPLRLYNRNLRATTALKFSQFTPIVGQQFGEYYYQVDAKLDATAYARIRHMGVPFFSSWDTYTFILSLLSMNEAFYAVFADSQIRQILFFDLFFSEDISKIYDALFKASTSGNTLTMDQILSLLRGSKLKCDATSTIFEKLKNL